MNIEFLYSSIELFESEVIESGFRRDVDDYISSLPNSQSNIITLREIAEKLLDGLDEIYSGDLPSFLALLLPTELHRPFTETPHNEIVRSLIGDAQLELPEFFAGLQRNLAQLKSQLADNATAINEIREFLSPYAAESSYRHTEEDTATVAIVFNDEPTITSLTKFSKTVTLWNRVLPQYHQLLTSESPEDIGLVEVQNGSIDLLVNVDIKIAVDLAEVFKVGFEVFGAYLSYKKLLKPITETYHGNKVLLDSEKERESHLLDNIGLAVKAKIEEQHSRALEIDKKIKKTSITKIIEQVVDLVTSHVVRGNDLKLIGLPEPSEDAGVTSEAEARREALQAQSGEARRQLREVPEEIRTKLLEQYPVREPDAGK